MAAPIYTKPSAVALPRNRKRTTTGLLLLAIFFPPLALYLDGAQAMTVCINFVLWINFVLPAIIHAFVYVLRPQGRRNMSRPCRYRLWVQNAEGPKPHTAVHNPETAIESPPGPPATLQWSPPPESTTQGPAPSDSDIHPADSFNDPPAYKG